MSNYNRSLINSIERETSRIPGPTGLKPRTVQCCKEKKTCCPTQGPSGSGNPGISRIPGAPYGNYKIPEGNRISTVPAGMSRPQFPGKSRVPEGPPGMSRIAATGRRSAEPSRTPREGLTRTIYAGLSRPPYAAISKTMMTEMTKPHPAGGKATGLIISKTTFTGPSAPNIRKGFPVSVTKSIPSVDKSKKGAPKPSRLQRFDRTVTAELSRRRDPTPTTTTTSDTGLLDAVDRLARAVAAHSFAGAVAAAEAAAAAAPDPTAAEEAAAQGARSYQARLVDVVSEDVPGSKPIQVIGYVGITRPKYPMKR